VILTLRADFSDRPLSHPTFGDLISRSSLLLAPMHPEQLEDAIRRPAARVGIDVEPGLVTEIIRDVSQASSSLPLLQYVLSELFERRTEDRLTVQAYRQVGAVHGVLERRAESIVKSLSPQAQEATRQLFLRMVQLGEHGEETRRRLPLTEVSGLGARAAVDEALEAFSQARILTYDRDPVSRTPTVEVAHETVIQHWPRLQVWIDDARAELRTHRRLTSDAIAWSEAGGDPEYLLSRGPLATAVELLDAGRLRLNELETTFVNESLAAEAERQQREEQVEHRSRRRLRVGIGATVVAALIGILAVFAFIQRQRADELAQQQERQSTARSLAAASLANLDSSDPNLSLLLAIEAAEQSLRAGEAVLPEVVDALHRAIITPRPDIVIEGARAEQRASVFAFAPGGVRMAMLAEGGGASVVDPRTGETLARLPTQDPDAFGIDFRFDGSTVLTVHSDALRQWNWRTGEMEMEIRPEFEVWTATYSRQGTRIAVGGIDGTIEVYDAGSGNRTLVIDGAHATAVAAIDFDPHGGRLISGGRDARVRIWDLASGDLLVEADTPNVRNAINDVVWHPRLEKAVVATGDAITLIIDTQTGTPLTALGNSGVFNDAVAHDSSGTFSMVAGRDGIARAYGTELGGEVIFTLPTAGVPLRDIEVVPGSFGPAVVGVDGKIRIYRDLSQSEKPATLYPMLYPRLTPMPDGTRYVINSNNLHLGLPFTLPGVLEVVDVASGESVTTRPTWRTSYTTGRAGITRDGSAIAFLGPEGEIEIVDVESGTTVTVPDSLDWANDLDFSPNGRLLAGASSHGSIAIWDRTTGETLMTLEGHGDRLPSVLSVPPRVVPNVAELLTAQRVDDVAWLEDGTRLVSAGFDGTVRLWDVTTGAGEVLYQFEHEVFSVALDPVGSQLVAVDRAGTVVEVDLEQGGAVRTLEPLSSGGELSFSVDGTMLAGTGPGGVTLWDVETGRITRQIRGSVYPTTDAVFTHDGKELLVSSGEGMIRGYFLDPLDLVAAAKGEVGRSMTDEECRRYLAVNGCDTAGS
jgi:WD40 repeat protein